MGKPVRVIKELKGTCADITQLLIRFLVCNRYAKNLDYCLNLR